jgi:predicted Ser/Thr protein kinase
MTTKDLCEQCGTPLPTSGGSCPRCMMKLGERPSAPSSSSPPPGPPSPTPREIAPDFPQLEILEFIGRGGMGVVYKARQRGLDRLVALKILPDECSADPTFAERFEREARVLARLDHPHIVRVHDAGKNGERYWLLMEFVDGLTLRNLGVEGSVTPRQSLALVTQICEALQYAHDAGVVHRDIKPENILVDRHGVVKIADFGLAKLLGHEAGGVTLTRSDQAMGTLQYMAPEQVRHPLEVDHRADIYSLGVVFYELLTGELPVGNFPLPSDREGVDANLDEVVLKSLEREPDRRYQSATDVRVEVERVSEVDAADPIGHVGSGGSAKEAGGGKHAVAQTPRARRGLGVGWVLLAGGCLLLLLLGAAAILAPVFFVRSQRASALEELESAHATELERRAENAAFSQTVPVVTPVTFSQVASAVGDVFPLTAERDLEMNATIQLGAGITRRSRESQRERKRVEVLEVTDGVITRAQVTYEEIEETKTSRGKPVPTEESPLLGKSYLLFRGEDGLLIVENARGETPPDSEREAVERLNGDFGRPGSYFDLLPKSAVLPGSPIDISSGVLRDLMNLDSKSGTEVEILTAVMTLRETEIIDGQEAGRFDVQIEMEMYHEKGMVMKSDLEGELLLTLDTSRPLLFELSGPFTLGSDHSAGSAPTSLVEIEGDGEMKIRRTGSF